MQKPIITLTTDFGLTDPYVAEMKAVILATCPTVTIVDITHQISKFNINMGAYILASASPFFPKGTIHVVVIDPGVGTKRKGLLIQTKKHYFIGPDNGVLVHAAEKQGIDHIYKISHSRLKLLKISQTFHGRDLFAPVAAHLAKGTPPNNFGHEIRNIKTLKIAKPLKRKNMLIGEVVYIDSFGNIVTNISAKDLNSIGNRPTYLIFNKFKLNICQTYGEVKEKQWLALIGSHNFLEISINQGNAAEAFRTKIGDKIPLSFY